MTDDQVGKNWLKICAELQAQLMADRITIRNLRDTGDRLAMFARHDEDCSVHGSFPRVCTCGFSDKIKAWKELGS